MTGPCCISPACEPDFCISEVQSFGRYAIHRLPGWSGCAEATSINAAQCTESKYFVSFRSRIAKSELGPIPGSRDRDLQQRRASNEMERMAENGTATFVNPDDYQAGGRGDASVNPHVTGGGDLMRA